MLLIEDIVFNVEPPSDKYAAPFSPLFTVVYNYNTTYVGYVLYTKFNPKEVRAEDKKKWQQIQNPMSSPMREPMVIFMPSGKQHAV